MDNQASLSNLISLVRSELRAAAETRRIQGEDAVFMVESVTIEVHVVAACGETGNAGLDLKIVTVGGEKNYSEQQIQKITMNLKPIPQRSRRTKKQRDRGNLDLTRAITLS